MLVDTSTLLRAFQPHHPHHEAASRAIDALLADGVDLKIVPQNCVELWVVATRPADQNGLGLSVAEALAELERLKTVFTLLSETPAIYPAWERLVKEHEVSGKPAHDARLVAAMEVHELSAILTFDRTGFARYPGVEVVHPEDVG